MSIAKVYTSNVFVVMAFKNKQHTLFLRKRTTAFDSF